MKVDEAKVLHAARHSMPLTIKTYTLPQETEIYLDKVLSLFLKELGQDKLVDPLSYCLRELTTNAKKANTKRVYFQERKLDINNANHYKEGMTAFKEDTLSNISHYLNLQKKADLYIKIIFHVKGRDFHIYVCNNSEITRKEQIRVYDRIARSRAFNSLDEALSTSLDDTEGAGLGIVMLVMMLKRLGLNEDAFDLDIDSGETIARISIPMSKVHMENLEILTQQIVSEINTLPQFPDNIIQLQQLINEPDSEIQDIAKKISVDPSLTADILKLVNSAQFMLPKKVDNIVEAVKLVGLRGLRNLLYSYGSQQVLAKEGGDQKPLWDHCYKTAYFAYNLARHVLKKKTILDDVYVAGILHDMGKIIFSAIHPNLINKINNFCTQKDIPKELFEGFSAGLNHAEIGALIAEKWNFPEMLIEAIRHHHNPQQGPGQHKDVIITVYLANLLCLYTEGKADFDHFDKDALAYFNIANEEQLKAIGERLDNAFSREKQD